MYADRKCRPLQDLSSTGCGRGGGTLPQAPLRSDERFVVWMRTAAVPNFRKLWGVIDQDLAAESVITISIVNA